MTQFKQDDIVVLLGAGASADAGIPTSAEMILKIESKLNTDTEWRPFRDLYLYVRSSIMFAEGLAGHFDPVAANYNIERLVATLDEIEKKTQHTLYPFVGTWHMRLLELAGTEFEKIHKFKALILRELKNWVSPSRWDESEYYRFFVEFLNGGGSRARAYSYPLRVFTLNYDLCLEHNCGTDLVIERGFDKTQRRWDWRRFELNENDPKNIFLYKLHGSIDWVMKEDQPITYVDNNASYGPDELALIFGTTYKLQAIDPYLFFAYEFRKWTLESRLIVTIGYGYGDQHINAIIGQALNTAADRRLLASAYKVDHDAERQRVAAAIHVHDAAQITIAGGTGREFITNELDVDKFSAVFPPDEAEFPEVT
jgi:hypothetical protein